MDCVAVIPARFNSSRFAGKPLALLAGRPLIQHVAERVTAVAGVERVIVATDDERIADAARAVGVEAMMTPESLASGTDRVAHVAEKLECSVVLNVQGDEPLIDPVELSEALAGFAAGDYQYGTLRAPLVDARDRWDPNVVKVVVDREGRALYFSRAPLPFPRKAWAGGLEPRRRAANSVRACFEVGGPVLDSRRRLPVHASGVVHVG